MPLFPQDARRTAKGGAQPGGGAGPQNSPPGPATPPGSHEAALAGCTCPQIDNHHGGGYRGDCERYVINASCPVHGGTDT